jgi:16S rRNA (guanine527-N7)-methyltransferase
MRQREGLLLRGLEELGISAPQGAAGSFMRYLEELKKWNRAYSLTGLRTDREIVIKHFLDSCLYLKALEGTGSFRVADVGSGAGFPGVPLKILRPEAEVLLIEPSGKKAAFLRHIVRTLGLRGVDVLERRLEEVLEVQVDAALTRALFKAGQFRLRASHIVRQGGLFVLSKGPRVREELKEAGFQYELKVMAIPFSDIRRYMVLIRK